MQAVERVLGLHCNRLQGSYCAVLYCAVLYCTVFEDATVKSLLRLAQSSFGPPCCLFLVGHAERMT